MGRADRIEARDGGLAVIDYKTSKNPMTKADAQSSLQLGFYVLAAREDAGLGAIGLVDQAELWYPLARSGITVLPFDPTELDGVGARMTGVAEGIGSEDWEPRPNDDCPRCPVRFVCQARPEGKEAFSG